MEVQYYFLTEVPEVTAQHRFASTQGTLPCYVAFCRLIMMLLLV
jgi:hypothetical protein